MSSLTRASRPMLRIFCVVLIDVRGLLGPHRMLPDQATHMLLTDMYAHMLTRECQRPKQSACAHRPKGKRRPSLSLLYV